MAEDVPKGPVDIMAGAVMAATVGAAMAAMMTMMAAMHGTVVASAVVGYGHPVVAVSCVTMAITSGINAAGVGGTSAGSVSTPVGVT